MQQNRDVTITLMTSCIGDIGLKTLKLVLGYVFSTLVKIKLRKRLSWNFQ